MSLPIRNYLVSLLFFSSIGVAMQATASSTQTEDPWEGMNRAIYDFNSTLDRWVLKPVTLGYQAVTPAPVESGVSNFFSNLLELRNITNSLLQGKPDKALDYTGRLIINSTFGLFGLLDIATPLGIAKDGGEDFGQTLAVWGIDSGPYLVLPFFGPSTLRDGTARFTLDDLTSPIEYIDDDETRWGLTALNVIDTRASLLDVEKLISGDEYTFVRDAYLQRREFLIKDGQVEDSFGDDIENYDF